MPDAVTPAHPRRTNRVEQVLLGLMVSLGSFVPHGNGPALALENAIGASAVPWPIRGAVCALVLCVSVWVLPYRRWPLTVGALLAWCVISSWAAICVASYIAATFSRGSAKLLAYIAAMMAVVVFPPALSIGLSPMLPLIALTLWPLLVWLPLAVGLWVRSRRDARRERIEHAQRHQAALAEQARAQERARIARDMHDVVAHRVSLMVLHAGALEANTPDEETSAQAGLLRTTGREALTQLRDVLGVLTAERSVTDIEEQKDQLVGLDALVERSRAAGLPVRLCREGNERQLPSAVERIAYQFAREALTNVHKHAGLASTEVTLRYFTRSLTVAVHNAEPTDPDNRLPGGGLGLAGLRERIELLGGELEARAQPDGGFLAWASLPVAAKEEPA